MTQPNRPEHSNRRSAIAGVSERLTIWRTLVGYSYPANGNVHNPTPRFHYSLQVDGVTVDRDSRERVLRTAAKENGVAYLAEIDSKI